MKLIACKAVSARNFGHIGIARHPQGDHQFFGPQRELAALALDRDLPFLARLVELRLFAGGGVPVVELHDPGVHLQPVTDLVFGSKHGPVFREGQVGQVVIPDRVMQAQTLVTIAPGVAGALVFLDDDGGHTELAQARAQNDAGLPAADDEHMGLFGVTQAAGLGLTRLLPAHASSVCAMLHPLGPGLTLGLFKALELDHGGQQGPGQAVLQAQQALAAGNGGLEAKPGFDDAVGLAGHALDGPGGRPDLCEGGLQHLAHLRPALSGLEVPGERQQVAPIAVLLKKGRGGLHILPLQCGIEIGQPAGRLFLCIHDRCLLCRIDTHGKACCLAGKLLPVFAINSRAFAKEHIRAPEPVGLARRRLE